MSKDKSKDTDILRAARKVIYRRLQKIRITEMGYLDIYACYRALCKLVSLDEDEV